MTSNTKALQAVVFDWAGTTVDHGSRAPAIVFQEIFRRQGVEITPAQAREPMGKAKRDHIATITEMPDVSERWQQKYGRAATSEDVDRMYEQFLPLQEEVLADHSGVISGVVETVNECRSRGLKIGASTGYTQRLMEIVLPRAAEQGYSPDISLTSDDAPAGRPAPWLLFTAAQQLNVYPMWHVVKVDDTAVGIEAGRNAGTWTVAITRTGNQLGLSEAEVSALSKSELDSKLEKASAHFRDAGAHYVVESVADLLPVLDDINRRLQAGESPILL